MSSLAPLEEKLATLKPILDSAGRAIRIVDSVAPKMTFELQGFCGGCACSSSYKEGLQDLVSELAPEYTQVEFIEC